MKKVSTIVILLSTILLITSCNVQPKYEYKTIGLTCEVVTYHDKVVVCYDSREVERWAPEPIIDYPTYDSILNEYGKTGWRVINVEIYSSRRVVTFERPLIKNDN